MVRRYRAGLLPLSLLAAVVVLLTGCASLTPAPPQAKVVKAARDITLPTLVTATNSGNVVCQASGSIPELARTYPGFGETGNQSFQWALKVWMAASKAGATDSFRQSADPAAQSRASEASGCSVYAQDDGWALSVFLFKDASAAASFLRQTKPTHSGGPPYPNGPVTPASGLGQGAWAFTEAAPSVTTPDNFYPEPNTWGFARMNVVAMFQTSQGTPAPAQLAQEVYNEIARAAA